MKHRTYILLALLASALPCLAQTGPNPPTNNVCRPERVDIHTNTFSFSAEADAGGPYALSGSNVEINVSGSVINLSNGWHQVVEYYTCSHTDHQAPPIHDPYAVVPEKYTYSWGISPPPIGIPVKWSGTGEGNSFSDTAYVFTAGVYSVKADFVGTRPSCTECKTNASDTAEFRVYQLTVTNTLWLGLDRTDAGTTNKIGEAKAILNPPDPATYTWELKSEGDSPVVCILKNTVENETEYWTTNKQSCSLSYLDQKLDVKAVITSPQPFTLSTSTNFTVVRVDVILADIVETNEETVGAFLAYQPDSDGNIPVGGTNCMKAVTITCTPANLPSEEMISLSFPVGTLFEIVGETLVEAQTNYPASEISSKQFFLHGHAVSSGLRADSITATHGTSEAIDKANFTVCDLSLTAEPAWLGLDRTDDGPTNKPGIGTATFTPGMSAGYLTYGWSLSGVCLLTNVSENTAEYWTTNKESCSGSYLDQVLTVTGTVSNAIPVFSLSASTNFTVVRLDVTVDGLCETNEEVVGAFIGYKADSDGAMTVEWTNALKAVSITCTPANLPSEEMIKLDFPVDSLYEKVGETLVNAQTNYPACEISSKQFFLHGHAVSSGLRADSITATHGTSEAIDKANFTVCDLSLTAEPTWLGLDRTDDGPTNKTGIGTATFTPGMSAGYLTYGWSLSGVCLLTNVSENTAEYWTTNKESCSGSYLDQVLTVTGIVSNAIPVFSLSASTNFTVVRLDVTIDGVCETNEETVGAFLEYTADTNGLMTAEGTNALKAVTITCSPSNLPSEEMIKITSLANSLYEKIGEDLVPVPAETNYPACEISSKQFFLHGHAVSRDLRADSVLVTHQTSGAIDKAKYTVCELTLTNTVWLGLDRTDNGPTNKTGVGTATFKPGLPAGYVTYDWAHTGVCLLTNTLLNIIEYWTTNKESCSGGYLDQVLTVTGAVSNAIPVFSLSASTNFTVVRLDVTIDGIAETNEETIGAFVEYKADTNGLMTAEGTNALKAVSITCTPGNLPTNEMVKIEFIDGFLYEKIGNGYTNAQTFYQVCEISSKQFFLHGHAVSGDLRDRKIEVTHVSSGAKDMAKYTVIKVDLEIYKPKVIGEVMIPDADELSKGSVTFVNLDNDDKDSKFDHGGPSTDDEVAGGDNELCKVVLKIEPSGLTLGQVKLLKMQGTGSFAVWTNDTKATASAYLETAVNVKDDFIVQGASRVKTMWLEGISPHVAQREAKVKMQYSVGSAIMGEDEASLTVIGVEKIEWKGKGNSEVDGDKLTAELAANWPTGLPCAAWRVFPDARIESGAVGTARDKVTVEATLTVEPPYEIKMYLASFDVDDPTSANGPVDSPGASETEVESTPDDNRGTVQRGTFISSGTYIETLTFPAGIKNTNCVFQVTMQPGDNFRIAANGDKDFLSLLANNDTAQNSGATDDEKNINKQRICMYGTGVAGTSEERTIRFPEKYASDVLTVWRFLHVEVDSMHAVPAAGAERNTVLGHIIALFGDGTNATQANLSFNLRTGFIPPDNSTNLSSVIPQNGRFENGWIAIGTGSGTPGVTTNANLLGNGDNYVRKNTGIDITAMVSKAGQPDISGKVISWTGNMFDLSVPDGTLSTNYNGGTLNVAGVTATIDGVTTNLFGHKFVVVTAAPAIPFVLHDDDNDTILPHTPDIGDEVKRKYGQLYILPVPDGGGNTNYNSVAVPFKLNVVQGDIPGVMASANALQSEANRLPRFWCAYVLNSYQFSATLEQVGDVDPNNPPRGDMDPNDEADLGGLNYPPFGTIIFWSCIVNELGAKAAEQSVITHEIAHQFGIRDTYLGNVPSPTDDVMGRGCWKSSSKFYPESIELIRSGTESPGKR